MSKNPSREEQIEFLKLEILLNNTVVELVKKNFSDMQKIPQYVYRGGDQYIGIKEILKKGGIYPRDGERDIVSHAFLKDYVLHYDKMVAELTRQLVSTSAKKECAVEFSKGAFYADKNGGANGKERNVVKVILKNKKDAIDVNNNLGKHKFQGENEIAFSKAIGIEQIVYVKNTKEWNDGKIEKEIFKGPAYDKDIASESDDDYKDVTSHYFAFLPPELQDLYILKYYARGDQ